jgi:hypothetical protein
LGHRQHIRARCISAGFEFPDELFHGVDIDDRVGIDADQYVSVDV